VEFVFDVLTGVAVLDDRQLVALVGPRRAAELRAIQLDVLNGATDTAH
jgi:hypothetical protein